MRKLLYTISFLLISMTARAQFNDTTKHHIVFSSTGSINKTDDAIAYLLNNTLNFGIKQKDLTLNLSGNWIYGKQDSALTNNDLTTALTVNLYKTFPHFYYWGLVNYNTSYSLKINSQLLAGAGVAYNIVDKKNVYVNVSDGVVFDQSDLVINSNYHTWRNSLRIQYHWGWKDIFTLDGNNFLQNSFSRGGDYIFRSTTTLGLKLKKWISLTTSLVYNKMNITKSDNLIFTYGLSVDKYF